MIQSSASLSKWGESEETLMIPEYLDTAATAALTGISKSTLEKWRVAGGQIPFVKAGRLVKYDAEDVRAWMHGRKVQSTSETPE